MIAELVTTTASTTGIDLMRSGVLPNAESTLDFSLAIQQMRRFSQLSGLPFWVVACDENGPRIISATPDSLPLIPNIQHSVFRDATGPHVISLESGLTFYSLPLSAMEETSVVAMGWIRLRPDRRPDDLVLAAVESGWTKRRLDEWLQNQPFASPTVVKSLLDATWAQATAKSKERELRSELIEVGEQIEQTYEEITLLHSLTGCLQLQRTPQELAEWVLPRVRSLTGASGSAIWIEDHTGEFRYLTSGTLPIDERGLARLCTRCEARDWSRPFVKNRLAGSSLERELPDLKNFVLCRVGDSSQGFGWMVHCNSEKDFGSVQASLLQSIAKILGTHLHNRDLFQQNEDLLMSFVRSMVSTIDAKDAYTRGHSERVALVARCLGEELGFPVEELEDIYLSGLLHDIGKVGVDDRILRKQDRLTDEEFDQIKKHPDIGCQILAGLVNLQHVIPGVRHHHESFDGRGYPDKLKGADIPLMARVMAVADAYDAMGSDRPYRAGMPLERIESIFRENVGPQWDPTVIAAYFRARVKIRKLWSAHRPSDLSSLASESSAGRSRFLSRS